MTTDRHACGLSSFLPMSCRGRAEAFARRLQSRLQSLGRRPSDDPTDSEESWLTNSQHFPTNNQPAARLSSSSDSDVYFDFDVYFGSPGSPLEEATEDDVHVNPTAASASSVTAMAASPGSDDSTYFDPEGFDFGKVPSDADFDAQCNGHDADPRDVYHERSSADPLEVSVCHAQPPSSDPGESTPLSPTHEALTPTNTASLDVTDNAGLPHCCTRVRKPRVDYTKCNGVRHGHSTETREAETNMHEVQAPRLTQSHEAEVERTTEMHEAKTEACGSEIGHSTEIHERDPNSNKTETRIHELEIERSTKKLELETETHEEETRMYEVETERSTRTHELETETHEEETRIHKTTVKQSMETHEEDTEKHEGETETHELDAEEYEADTNTYEAKVKQSTATDDAESVYRSVAELSDLFRSTLSVSTHKLLVEYPSPVPGVEVTVAPTAPKAPPRPPREESKLEVDDVDDEERPPRVRRCSSLKTGKTPPGTPGRKKIVRFADVLGLDLADVRTFLDEVPKVPTSAYEDLTDADFSASLSSLAAAIGGSMPKPDKTLVPMFVQPGGCADFFDRVREQQVCLENAVVSDVILATITGTVRVRNLDFNKSVHIRYSVDGWKTFSDLQARYVLNSCDGFSDTFSFVLYAHTVTVGQRLEFAVRFQCHGCQYWDSNRGSNYAFQCLPPAGQMPFRSHPMSTCPDEQWASFY